MNAFISKIRDTMMRWGRSTAGFYRANRGIVISGLTVISILLIVWARLGFTIQISQFFAASPGPTVVINSSLPIKYGQTLSVSWSATGATTCNASSWISTGGANQGTATSAPVNACLTSSGTFSITCTYPDGTSGTTTKTFAVDKSSCPSATPSPTPTPTGGGGGGGGGGGTGSCHWQNPDERQLASCACSYDGNRSNLCHVCAPAWQEGDTQYTDAQWTAWDNLGLCRPSCPAIDPYQTERTMPNGSQFPLPQGCVEKPSDCPDGYHAFGDTVCQPNATSTATPTATPIPTASPTATPSATPTATPSASPTATPTTSPTGIPVPLGLTLTVGGANLTTNAPESTTVSATDGQIVSVIAILSNPQPATGQALTNVLVQASLPAGIAYIAGTTTIDGATAPDGVVNTGITLASIGPSQFHRTVFNVKIDASMFPVGSSQAIVRVNASASGITPQSGQLIITITKGVVQPGAVQTGPADAVLLAFLVSAVTTLLYVSYTHTSVYRRHELEQFGRERGPLDFRS